MEKGDNFNFVDDPVKLKSMSVGIYEDDFLLAFNCDENNTPEYACVVPSDKLKDVIGLLFSSGMEFENSTGKNIGFHN